MKQVNQLAFDLKISKLHLGTTKAGESIYKSVGYKEPNFLNLEIKF